MSEPSGPAQAGEAGAVPAATILQVAGQRRDQVLQLQQELHQIPELAFQEVETTRYVESFLDRRGIGFDRLGGATGGVAVIGEGDPVTLLRADLDGLPVVEDPAAGQRSRHEGRMHACGHDAHTAMLLTAAAALAAAEVPFRGRVVCLFQPAEEGGGGCQRLLRQGLLHKYPAGRAVALHVWPQQRTGSLALSPGPVMAGMDAFRLRFLGRGGHGAYPHACVDPVVMAAEAVLALQTLVSRRVDPLAAAVVTVGRVDGGSAGNVIPDAVQIEGTLRSFDPAVREDLLQGVRRVAGGVAAAHGGESHCEFYGHYPTTCNDPAVTEQLRTAFAAVFGAGSVLDSEPTMGSEDMSFLLQQVPGCYLRLGCASAPERAAPLHSPRFHVDPACLPVGVAALLTAACCL